jgi:predicted nucleic acid-binding protein
MDNKLNEIRRIIRFLRSEMLSVEDNIRKQLNRDEDCSEAATRLLAMRATMVGLIGERNRLGGEERLLTLGEVEALLRRLTTLDVRRIPITGALLDAAWRMRDNIAARDALYVAAARDLGCVLLTTDERLARAVPDLAIGHAE